MLREHKRRYTIKKRKNELKEIIHDRIPLLFRVHLCNFCLFPLYPSWQSHKYDPLVLVQFASSWQEWFPLHSLMSMKSQMKKWDFRIMQKLPCISHCCVKECKPWLFSTFRWIARTRDFHTWWKKVVYAKTYLFITFSQVTVSPILNN